MNKIIQDKFTRLNKLNNKKKLNHDFILIKYINIVTDHYAKCNICKYEIYLGDMFLEHRLIDKELVVSCEDVLVKNILE